MTHYFPRELRDMSFVHRWGIVRCIKPQNIAEHSFYVAYYSMQIYRALHPEVDIPPTLLIHALCHDLAETATGDIPGPSKRAITDADTLKRFERQIVYDRFGYSDVFVEEDFRRIIKVADLIDEVMYLLTERTLGNNSIIDALDHSTERLLEYVANIFPEPHQMILLKIIQDDMLRAGPSGQSTIYRGN